MKRIASSPVSSPQPPRRAVPSSGAEIVIENDKSEEAKTRVKTHLDKLFKRIQLKHPGRYNQRFGQGSTFERVKVKSANEFDFAIPIRGTFDETTFVSEPKMPHFGAFKLKAGHEWGDCETKGFFDSQKAKCKFLEHVRECIGSDSTATITSDGPAVTLEYQKPALSVDLVLTVQSSFWPQEIQVPTGLSVNRVATVDGFVAKPAKEPTYYTHNYLWRLSFAETEKNWIYFAGGCRKKCLRILKHYRETDPVLSKHLKSYHLKTLLFHEMKRLPANSEWTDAKLPSRVIGLLRKLSESILEKRLLHYFVATNLLSHLSNITAAELSLVLHKIAASCPQS